MSAVAQFPRPYRTPASASGCETFPAVCEGLEEAAAAEGADAATVFAFALSRLTADNVQDHRPLALVTTPAWTCERGRPFAGGLEAWGAGFGRVLWVRAQKETEALWALEEALKSSAVAGGLATVQAPSLVATRRLIFAAREGDARAMLLRVGPSDDLSAARRRWRIAALASGPSSWDAAAPGSARLRAELVRRRDGPPAAWTLEWNDETRGFAVAARLADHGLAQAGPARKTTLVA